MLRYFPPERRRRLAPLILILGLVIVGKLAHDEMPRDQELTFVLPRSLSSLRVTYLRSQAEQQASSGSRDEFLGGFERRFPDRSPAQWVHTPSLSPGRYRLAIELVHSDGGVSHLDRSIDVPQESALRIPLTEH